MEDLLFKYKSELKNKIELQGIKNKPFSQILLQSFKYFDKNSSGLCNYDTFIKVNKKFDIILEPQEFQKIFFYYDVNNEEIIHYNDLVNDIFNSNDSDNIINLNYEDENSQNNILNNLSNISNKNSNNIPPYKKPFFGKIINNLLNNELGPSIALLIFYQGFILADNNYIQKFTLKEFVKIMNDNDINLSISDIQTLFHTYNLNNDGFFYYEKMFEDIINKYMNNQRKKIIQNSIEEIMNKLNKIAKGKINLFNLQNYIFLPEISSNFFYNKLNIIDANEYYNELINKYLGIKRILNYPRDSLFTKENLEEIINYISFGINDNNDFNKALNYIFLSEKESNKNYAKDISANNSLQKQNKRKQNENIQIENKRNINKIDIWPDIKICFVKMGLKNFLNMIKVFQEYNGGMANNNNYLDKNNFRKLMNDFNINISNDLINIIYKNNNDIDFIYFICELINKFISKESINIIENLFNNLHISCLNISGKSLNLDFFFKFSNCSEVFQQFHDIFYEKYFCKNNKRDIYDIINNKNLTIEKNEFIWFYKFIFFFDKKIKEIINNHWKKIFNNDNKNNITYNEPEVILKLKTKLKKRGIRGLMNLHREFIISCKDLSSISLEDLQKVFYNQRLSFNNEEIIKIFNLFKLSENREIFNFTKFIRVFKKSLNKERLSIVQNAFENLDINRNNSVNISKIKYKFNEKGDLRVLKGEKNDEEILCEFLDCFDLNYKLLFNNESFGINRFINFEEFANFYEYVSFLYDNDQDFIQLVGNTWN